MSHHWKVLLTGVTGFLGSHTTIQLLNKGYRVVGTLRDKRKVREIKGMISKHAPTSELGFEEVDLLDENRWGNIMKVVDFVFHMASPFPETLPKHEDDLIKPAREGTLNVLNAASKNRVKRVVFTSSSGAITYGQEKSRRSRTYTENDWTDLSNSKDTTPYYRSKTLAEKAAWDFVTKDMTGLELTVICPGAILGPLFGKHYSSSVNIVKKTMDGTSPAVPRMGYDIVDVRSLADLHIRAMETEEAAGERFIGSSGFLTFKQIADILREQYPNRKLPKPQLPDFAVKLFSHFEKSLKAVLLDLGVERKLDSSKARKLLNWKPISPQEAVLSCAESLIALGIL